jgi:glycosyltransferase involved in cell wall biosynthesis
MSDRLLAVSEAVAERAIERDGIPRERVAVVPNGIEAPSPRPRERSRLRKMLRLGDEMMLFLFLGRLHHEKGPDLLIDALVLLRREEPEGWRVVFVGDGSLKRELESKIDRLGLLDKVYLAGGRRRVGPWLEACDALILPSREEGMPVAAIEAMMCGRAVLATRVGGSPEVVLDGETGLTVPAEDAAALARGLARLLRDPGLTRRLGAQGRERGRREFSIDRMTEGTMRQYEQLMPLHEAGAKRVAALTARAE